ncbi:Vacuolar transporter chaperone 4 [Smittium culicis]|uniref:Vacuolar transporter chaperone complex subunit 4 n=1 Tax=Smittium culicis TaxID=133412 RepID=A0A1R1XXZ9_9FUNG|nr:Vacuolar transporter chaperone 4 [Smittium culicis]OMJ19553.1 Vacuolar transporter chaperone 4 [Smittium culicis]
MKFGQKLQESIYPDWKFYYLDYAGFKSYIYTCAARGYTAEDESEFVSNLEEEIEKMQDFQQAKIKEVKRRIENCYTEIDLINKNRGTEEAKLSQFSVIEEEINMIIAEVNELAKYTRINFTALVKIVKKHDKNVSFMLKPIFTQKINSMPFFKESFDVLLLKLSRLYKIVRDGGKDLSKNVNPQSGNGQTFVRQTTKYWVHPDNVMELKLFILKNLPVLVYSNNQNKPVNPAITSIYFDNTELDLYKGRIEKVEGAEAIRLRWYGDDQVPDIFVERKTHREDWTGEKSVKERFSMKEKHVNSYLSGTYDFEKKIAKLREEGTKSPKDIDDMERLSRETLESVKEKKLVPVLRTFYNRTAFQLPGDASVRISLDTELSMIREDNFDGIERAGLNWRRTDIHGDYPFPQLPERDICRFPYAVLEVKLQTERGENPPRWVTSLINSHLVESVPKFSKFIHGVSTLLEDRVDILPFWFSQMDKDIRKKPNKFSNFSLSSSARNSFVDLTSFSDLSSNKNSKSFDYKKFALAANSSSRRNSPSSNASYGSLEINDQSTEGNDQIDPNRFSRKWYNLYGLLDFNRPKYGSNYSEEGFIPRQFPQLPIHDQDISIPGSSSYGSTCRDASDSGYKKIIQVPARVEPKVFFANERTFLAWLNFSMLLGSLSLGLLNFGDQNGRYAGVAFTLVSIMAMFYALSLFHWRADRIGMQNVGPYDDRLGPTLLVIALFCAISLNFYFKFSDYKM